MHQQLYSTAATLPAFDITIYAWIKHISNANELIWWYWHSELLQ